MASRKRPRTTKADSEKSTGIDARASSAARILCFALLLSPLVVLPGLLFPYVTARAVYFGVLTQAALLLMVFLLLRRRAQPGWRSDPMLQALLIFLVTQLIAAAAGEAPVRSIFSDLERMWGVWGWAEIVAFYFLLRVCIRPVDWQRYLRVALGVGVTVGVAAVYGDAMISTIGNSGVFACFEFFTLGFAALLSVREGSRPWRVAYAVSGAVAVVGIVASRNRSSVLALVLAVAVFAVIRAKRRFRLAGILAGILVVGSIGLVELGNHTQLPGVLGRISRTSLSPQAQVRTLYAKVTLDGLREHPVLGVGPENFDFLWSRHFEAINYKAEPDVRSDREHNAFLEAIATSGLLGGVAFILIWVAAFASLVRAVRKGSVSLEEGAVCAAIYAGYAAYLMFWFVDINPLIPFVAVTAFVSTKENGGLLAFGERRRWSAGRSAVLGLATTTLAVVVYFADIAPLKLARSLVSVALGNAPIETSLHDAYAAFDSRAPERSQTIVLYAGYIEKLAPILASARAQPYERAVLDTAFQRGALEFDKQIAREPTNLRLLLLRGRFYYLAAQFYGNAALYGPAERDMRRVIAVTPARLPPHVLLSSIRLALGDTVEALAEARTAVTMQPNVGEPHYQLGQVLSAKRGAQGAAEELKRALSLAYLGPGSLFRGVAFQLQQAGLDAASADLMTAYLAKRYGPLEVWERFAPQPRMVEPADSAMLLALPIENEKANRADAARVATAALAVAMPGFAPKALSAR